MARHETYILNIIIRMTIVCFCRCLQALQVISNNSLEDERCRGAVHKAAGQIARLASVLTALQNGVAVANNEGSTNLRQPQILKKSVVESAYSIVKLSLDQKFCLYSKPIIESRLQEEDDVQIVEAPGPTWDNCSDFETPVQLQKERKRRFPFKDNAVSQTEPNTIQNHPNMVPRSSGHVHRTALHEVAEGRPINTSSKTHRSRTRGESAHCSEVVYGESRYRSNFGEENAHMEVTHVDKNVRNFQCHSNTTGLGIATSGLDLDTNTMGDIEVSGLNKNVFPLDTLNTLPSNQFYLGQPIPNQMFVNQAHTTWEDRPSGGNFVARDRLPDVYELDENTFVMYCAAKIKKLLLTRGSMVTAAFACQYRLFPPVPRSQRRASMKTTHPVWAAGKFFERVEKLGLGVVISRRGMSIRLRKKRLEDIDENGKEIMKKINLLPEEYERSYPKAMGLQQRPTFVVPDIAIDPTVGLDNQERNSETHQNVSIDYGMDVNCKLEQM